MGERETSVHSFHTGQMMMVMTWNAKRNTERKKSSPQERQEHGSIVQPQKKSKVCGGIWVDKVAAAATLQCEKKHSTPMWEHTKINIYKLYRCN